MNVLTALNVFNKRGYSSVICDCVDPSTELFMTVNTFLEEQRNWCLRITNRHFDSTLIHSLNCWVVVFNIIITIVLF